MNIVIRVDASDKIGTGHVIRCLTIAELLNDHNDNVYFICRKCKGDMITLIENKGYKVFQITAGSFKQTNDAKETIHHIVNLQDTIDWVIVDHYKLDHIWEKCLKEKVNKIMVIDDLANRRHDCDLLLDQNFYINMNTRYIKLVPAHCKLLLGPKYLLLRKEFLRLKVKEKVIKKDTSQRVLVFFGGSDPTNETEKFLETINQFKNEGLTFDVVVGSSNPNKKRIQRLAEKVGASYHYQIDYLSYLMQEADFSFGAGGMTMWERCYLGLPTFVTVAADNQTTSTEDAHKVGVIYNLGWHEKVSNETYEDALRLAIDNPKTLETISKICLKEFNSYKKNNAHPLLEVMNSLR
ncbi:UDP-2,4-diacetamido-2,4,6-trideoxy-beta-L-altropyranose hydrolase [Gracilibacillus lacisalsi]|uniref:UDP-2,4-diacetamido-2,4, 6-trideoxy-beta-L-altropyranose hydrolase n=1 Tax=Gracilibacillus lacisalsi TaxID=393087 RepID=UPI00037736B9|nr:UDP-2,4-diacetamido-2,4,6-trideoxy-beta-L-altropyranose hydrolase [Gracilibacillus lacisalsi]